MKKILTLITVCMTVLSALAQRHDTMNFVGDAQFYLPAMQEQTLTTIKNDTVKVDMRGDTQSIIFPDMTYAAMHMTIKSFTVSGLSYTMTGSHMTGDMAFEWTANNFSTTITGTDGKEKTIKVSALKAKYTHSTRKFNVEITFTYGSMPMALHYDLDGYYTSDITDVAGVHAAETKALNGKYMKNGKLVIVRDGKTFNTAGQIIL